MIQKSYDPIKLQFFRMALNQLYLIALDFLKLLQKASCYWPKTICTLSHDSLISLRIMNQKVNYGQFWDFLRLFGRIVNSKNELIVKLCWTMNNDKATNSLLNQNLKNVYKTMHQQIKLLHTSSIHTYIIQKWCQANNIICLIKKTRI